MSVLSFGRVISDMVQNLGKQEMSKVGNLGDLSHSVISDGDGYAVSGQSMRNIPLYSENILGVQWADSNKNMDTVLALNEKLAHDGYDASLGVKSQMSPTMVATGVQGMSYSDYVDELAEYELKSAGVPDNLADEVRNTHFKQCRDAIIGTDMKLMGIKDKDYFLSTVDGYVDNAFDSSGQKFVPDISDSIVAGVNNEVNVSESKSAKVVSNFVSDVGRTDVDTRFESKGIEFD